MKYIRKKKLFEEYNTPNLDYVIHENKWLWGKSQIIITSDAYGLVNVSYENEMFTEEGGYAAVLSGLIVHPTKRHSGYGRALVQKAESVAKENGAKLMILWADKNDWVINWYKRLGYVESDYPREQDEPDLVELEKELQ